MFAIVTEGIVTEVFETEVDGSVPVIDGTIPPLTSPLGAVLPLHFDQWTVGPSSVTRTWQQVFPPMLEMRRRKRAALERGAKSEHDGGITAGGFTFASDVLPDMLACARIAEMSTRMGNQAQNISFVLADNTIQPVQAKDALTLVMAYCVEHHRRHVAMANKLRAVSLATTIPDIETIT